METRRALRVGLRYLKCRYFPAKRGTGSPIFDYVRTLGEEMETREKEAVRELETGVLWVTFTGGEPLLRPDLEEIAGEAKGGAILDTNAVLVTEERAKSLGGVFEIAGLPPGTGGDHFLFHLTGMEEFLTLELRGVRCGDNERETGPFARGEKTLHYRHSPPASFMTRGLRSSPICTLRGSR